MPSGISPTSSFTPLASKLLWQKLNRFIDHFLHLHRLKGWTPNPASRRLKRPRVIFEIRSGGVFDLASLCDHVTLNFFGH